MTTPQDLSLLDTGRALGLFRQAQTPAIGVVKNMSYMTCPHCGDEIQVFHRSERPWEVQDSELEMLGRVPLNLTISRGIAEDHALLKPESSAPEAAVFREIATRVSSKAPAA